MDLPTICSTFDGETINQKDCFKLIDSGGTDITELLRVKSFSVEVGSTDYERGAMVTARVYFFPEDLDLIERLGIEYHSKEEAHNVMDMHVIRFRAIIKILTQETV